MNSDVQRLESERLRPMPHERASPRSDPLDELFRELLDLIAGECRRAGYLPSARSYPPA